MAIFVNIVVSCIASSLLSTALATALPPIIEEFNVEVAVGQWITSIYSLVMAIMIPMTAFLAKRVPTKPLYIGVIATFLVGTALCIFAPNIPILLVGRALQAMGGGAITTIGQIVLFSIFPMNKRGSVMGWYGLALSAAPIVAPTLGGFMCDTTGWRSIFVLVFVAMAFSLAFACIVFTNVLPTSHIGFDVFSFVLTAVAFGGTTYGIGTLAKGFDTLGCAALALGLIGAVLFVYRQLHLRKPFLNVRVFTSYRFRMGVIAGCLLYFVMIAPMTTIPLVVQAGFGLTATISGLVLLPGAICGIVMNPIAGKLYDHIGARRIVIVGSSVTLISMVSFMLIRDTTPVAMISVGNALRCFGSSLVMMPLMTWAISGLTEEETADGTSLYNALTQMIGSVSTAVSAGIMGNRGVNGFDMSSGLGALIAVALLAVCILFVKYRPDTGSKPVPVDVDAARQVEDPNPSASPEDVLTA